MRKTSVFENEELRRNAPDILAVAVLAAFLTFFYWGFLAGHCFIWDDTLTEFYPGVNYFAKSVMVGRFPLWFPGVRDGMPFYSDPQMAVFYPPQWLLIPFVRGGRLPFLVYQRYIVLHYVLGGVFMYAFLKHLKLSPVAALSGALVFSLSGFSSLRIVNFVMIQVYVWLPLQLLCVRRFATGRSHWTWLGLVGAMVVSLMAGHPQTTIYCWYLVAVYWLYCCYDVRRKVGADSKAVVRLIVGRDVPKVVGTFALVLGLSATMLVPVTENWLRSGRPRQSFDTVADTSLPRDQLLTLLVPRFFGESRSGGAAVAFWGYDPRSPIVQHTSVSKTGIGFWQYWEFGAYAGQMFWVAAFLLLLNWRRIENRQTAGFFLIVWLGALWFMLGRYGGLFQILYYSLPGSSMFRGPAKMSCVATLAAAVLCAQAIDLLNRRFAVIRVWPAFLPAAGCACLSLALCFAGEHLADGFTGPDRLNWARHETVFSLAVSATCALTVLGVVRGRAGWQRASCLCVIPICLVVDFHHAYGDFQRGADHPDTYYPETSELLLFLKNYHGQHHPFRFAQIIRDQVREELTCHRNYPYFHEFLEFPEGYTTFFLDSVAKFQGITNQAVILNVQNVALATERDAQGDSWMDIFRGAFPRAKFFARVRQFDSRETLLRALERDEFEWRNEAAVCELPTWGALHEGDPAPASDITDEVQFESLTPESYAVRYNVSRPGIIFISQTFYPGWAVSGGNAKLTEVFGAFQGIVVPQAGRGKIVVHFSPPALKLGIAITLLSVTAAGLVFPRLRRRLTLRPVVCPSPRPADGSPT